MRPWGTNLLVTATGLLGDEPVSLLHHYVHVKPYSKVMVILQLARR